MVSFTCLTGEKIVMTEGSTEPAKHAYEYQTEHTEGSMIIKAIGYEPNLRKRHVKEAIEILKRKPQLNEDAGKAKIFPMFKDIVKKEQEERIKQKKENDRPGHVRKSMSEDVRETSKQSRQEVPDSELDETIPYVGEEMNSENEEVDMIIEKVREADKESNPETEASGEYDVLADWDDDLYSDVTRPTRKRQRFSNAPAIQEEIVELYRKGGKCSLPESQNQDQEGEKNNENMIEQHKSPVEYKKTEKIGEIRRSRRINNKSQLNATVNYSSKNEVSQYSQKMNPSGRVRKCSQ